MEKQHPENLFELFDHLDKRGIPKSLYWKYIGPFLQSKSRKLHIPVHGIFELTPLCNFDCKMCYVHINNCQLSGRKLLTSKKWKELADSAYKNGLRSLALTGGECLIYPDFDDLYVYLVSSGIKVYIMSNGYCIDQKIKLFEEFKPAGIQISLYGSSDEAYEAVTGVRAFSKVYDNTVRIRDAGFRLSISITPSIFMRDDIEAVISLAEGLHVKYGVNPQLTVPREETGRNKEDLSVDDYINIYHFLSLIHHEDLKTIDWSKVPEPNHGGQQRYGIRCGAGRSSFGIKYDGSMCPCLSLDNIVAKPFEIGFESAWKQINDAADEYELPLECGDCAYQKQCLSCVAIHNGAPIPGHCDPTVCERMKRLVQEGFIPLKNLC